MSRQISFEQDEKRWSQWMTAANAGDSEVYTKLLTELGQAIEQYIRSRFGDLRALEDCVQESLFAIHKARHTYDPARAFRPWLFTIVRHKTIDLLRRTRHDTDLDTSEQVDDIADNDNGREQLDALIDGAKVLRSIAPDHREAVALTQYAGYTVPEAALEIGISESAMKARLRRGLAAIKRQLAAEEWL